MTTDVESFATIGYANPRQFQCELMSTLGLNAAEMGRT
jgi:hypothetical protein